MTQWILAIAFLANFSFSEDSTSFEVSSESPFDQNLDTTTALNLREKILTGLGLENIVVGKITRNPIVNREPMTFELCNSFGTQYHAFKVTRRQLNGSTYQDIEIQFDPMSKEQFENLKSQIGENRSQVTYSPQKKYTLVDFLPPQYQASHAIEESHKRGLFANCWGTAYEMKNPSNSFFYSTTFDTSEQISDNKLLSDVLDRGTQLGDHPNGRSLRLGDLQFFHSPFDGPEAYNEFAHGRSFVACEKNGNHLMYEMPALGLEPRRFVLSTAPWISTGNFPHWYRIDRTNTAFYPQRGSEEFKDHIYTFRYDQEGRAHLVEKRESLESFIKTNFSDDPLKGVATYMPYDSTQEVKMSVAWEILKKDFKERNGQFDITYMTDVQSIKSWFLGNENFFFNVIQADPSYREINEKLKEFGLGGAF